MKRTPWFDAAIKPARVGMYERNYGSPKRVSVGRCYWNGRWWSWSQGSANAVPGWKTTKSSTQDRPWRGLAEAPE